MSITEAALFLAQAYPVFPVDASKRPLTARGFKDATRDPTEIRALFARAHGIGVPTGTWSGFVAIDIDVKEGRAGLEWLAANEHRLPRTRRHRTQSGGFHLLFLAPPGRTIRNSASKIAPGIDVRADGGYVVAPPTPGYSVADDAMPAPLPAWLLDLLDPPRPAPTPAAPIRMPGEASRYALAALDNECTAIMQAADGAKHDTLNRAAYSIGGLVAAGEIPETEARSALESALSGIRHRCEDYPAAQRTLAAAFRAGIAAPRNPPAPRITRRIIEEYEPIAPEPPPIEEPPEHWYAEPEVDIPEPPRAGNGKMPLRIIRFSEAQAALDADDFVEGLLVRNAMSVIYGESNSGKTFFALDLALHVAAGIPWRGREVDQGFVLYLALEGSHAILNRVAAFKREHGLEGVELPFAIVPVSLNLLAPNADADAVVETCRAVAAEYGVDPALIVVDTLARAISGGNENDAEDMGSLIKTGDLLRQQAPAHVMWIHHCGKDAAKGARGHSSLRAATDTEIEVIAAGPNRQASVTKQRDMECEGAFPFTLRVVDLGANRRGKAVTSCVVDPDAAPAGPQAYRPRVTGHAKRAFEILNDIMGSAEPGFPGVPAGIPSIPEKWWREAFYDRAMPGSEAEAKKKAFQRATKELDEGRYVAGNKGRIWIVRNDA
jgi:hypothetical protein